MSERWRCFVAVPVGEGLRRDVAAATEGWRERADLEGLRWTDPAALHLTLAFLGSVDPGELSRIHRTVDGIAAHHEPMHLRTEGLGAFPSARRARVAWLGIADPDGSMAALAADLRSALDLDQSGPFRAHLTLARARNDAVDAGDWVASASAPDGELVVDRLEVMRSHLGGGPTRYEVLASPALGAETRV